MLVVTGGEAGLGDVGGVFADAELDQVSGRLGHDGGVGRAGLRLTHHAHDDLQPRTPFLGFWGV